MSFHTIAFSSAASFAPSLIFPVIEKLSRNNQSGAISLSDEDIATRTRRHHCLSQVAIHLQLSYHVTLGFSRHVVIVSIITSSYDIKTG
jgi:hypothetical protein